MIPPSLILSLHNLQIQNYWTIEDAVTHVRAKLVPDGYTPYPFRRETPETFLDKLRSLVATCYFRHMVSYWKTHDADFSLYMYVPEMDPITKNVHHERGDHNHILKRIGHHTRDGKFLKLNCEAFDEAMLDKNTGLTYTALIGQRKQSVVDAERLLSHHVAKFFRDKNHHPEADYVETIANWHEASDGCGMSQLERCRANYKMLNYLLDEWMPWHKSCYNFSFIDINR